jgi:N-formylglutamate amidohydrolase
VFALMIEINRALYMDEQTGRRRPRFTTLAGQIQHALRRVIDLGTTVAPT